MSMNQALAIRILAVLFSVSCKGKAKDLVPLSDEPTEVTPSLANHTVNDFFRAGAPTFIVGTVGDERSDRVVASQVALVRGLLSPSSLILDSKLQSIEPSSWPQRPVVYGGSHINSVMGRLGDSLPFQISSTSMHIGGKHFEGDGYQLVTVVPKQNNHPEFLLFAGTGTPGIAEINAIGIGPNPIVIADAFGHLHTGQWVETDGTLAARLSPAKRRIKWRDVTKGTTTLAFVEALPPRDDEMQLITDIESGVAVSLDKLEIDSTVGMTIYVSPDQRSKISLTGKGGQGHALPEFRVLHVVAMGGGALKSLVAHEATHLLAYSAFGQARTPALGEGIAVWVSGQYGGTAIKDFAASLGKPIPINELLGPGFRKLPEGQGYMHAGLLVGAAVAEVGIKEVGKHLLGASAGEWQAACIAAGTTAAKIETAYLASFGQ